MLRGGFKAIHGDLLHIRFREKITKLFSIAILIYNQSEMNRKINCHTPVKHLGCVHVDVHKSPKLKKYEFRLISFS